jgi:cell volume regulation protein A
LLLATVGVIVTAVITGLAAASILGVRPLVGLLLGSIVASTDAAAVFSILRSQGLHLRSRVAATLEIESGSNDPMAIFMTIGLLEVLSSRLPFGPGLLTLFIQQMGIGAVVGVGAGWLAVRVVNHIQLAAPGLYPVLAGACGLAAFGLAASTGGSGFLAIYLAGIVIGNSVRSSSEGRFSSSTAWRGSARSRCSWCSAF